MKSLLDSIWETEEKDVLVDIQMAVNCIVISCGTKPPPPNPEPSSKYKVCAVPY